MDDFQKEIVKEVVKQMPIKDIYDDGAKSSVKAIGDTMGLLPRAINAALEPLHKWVMQKEYNIEETKKILQNKLNHINPELITPPDSYIGVPVLQAISYSMDSSELRDMYANLLASSMISGIRGNVHPSFVEIIKQLSPDEARIFKIMPEFGRHVPIIDIGKNIKNKMGIFVHYTNFSMLGYKAGCEYPKNIPQYINNLCRLGIAEIPNFCLVEEWRYIKITNTDYFKSIIKDLEHYELTKKCFGITTFGNEFRKVCVLGELSSFILP